MAIQAFDKIVFVIEEVIVLIDRFHGKGYAARQRSVTMDVTRANERGG
jgi:hypothetical protein